MQIQRRVPLAPVQIYSGDELTERVAKTKSLIDEIEVCGKNLDELKSRVEEFTNSLGLSSAVGVVDEAYASAQKQFTE